MFLNSDHNLKIDGWIEVVRGGRTLCSKPNVVLYPAADLLARMISGDSSAVPGFIGFVYADGALTIPNPASDPEPRRFSWNDIISNIGGGVTGNVVITPIDTTPRISASSGLYTGNTVTFSGMSDVAGDRVYTALPAPTAADKYFQVVLLSRRTVDNVNLYTPFAYSQLVDGSDDGISVVSGLEMAVHWSISLKIGA